MKKDLISIFKTIKRAPFIDNYSEPLNPSAIHRFAAGKMSEDDEIKVCNAWDKFKDETDKIVSDTRKKYNG